MTNKIDALQRQRRSGEKGSRYEDVPHKHYEEVRELALDVAAMRAVIVLRDYCRELIGKVLTDDKFNEANKEAADAVRRQLWELNQDIPWVLSYETLVEQLDQAGANVLLMAGGFDEFIRLMESYGKDRFEALFRKGDFDELKNTDKNGPRWSLDERDLEGKEDFWTYVCGLSRMTYEDGEVKAHYEGKKKKLEEKLRELGFTDIKTR